MLLLWHLLIPRWRAVRLVRIRLLLVGLLLVRVALLLLVLRLRRLCPKCAQVKPGRFAA